MMLSSQPTRMLLLLRHAHAAHGMAVADYDRPLTAGGRREAEQVACRAVEQGTLPELILASSALRARQTAQIFGSIAGTSDKTLYLPELYLASMAELLTAAGHVPDEINRLMIVGHNPGLMQLAATLAGGRLPHNSLPPATLVVVAVNTTEGGWSTVQLETAKLIHILSPGTKD